VIAVSAVRTGCGKSPVSRWLSRDPCASPRPARRRGAPPSLRAIFARQSVQRFGTRGRSGARGLSTIEERENTSRTSAAATSSMRGGITSTINRAGRSRIRSQSCGTAATTIFPRAPRPAHLLRSIPCARATNAPTTPGNGAAHGRHRAGGEGPMRPKPGAVQQVIASRAAARIRPQ